MSEGGTAAGRVAQRQEAAPRASHQQTATFTRTPAASGSVDREGTTEPNSTASSVGPAGSDESPAVHSLRDGIAERTRQPPRRFLYEQTAEEIAARKAN